jgi:hypothetical protein
VKALSLQNVAAWPISEPAKAVVTQIATFGLDLHGAMNCPGMWLRSARAAS